MTTNRAAFDKNYTFSVKGIAILFMVLHHTVALFYNQVDLSWYAQHSTDAGSLILLLFSTAGKVCVQLLTILSGYGLAKSYMKFSQTRYKLADDARFVLSHLLQFYSLYWVMFAVNVVLRSCIVMPFGTFYGTNGNIAVHFLADFFGVAKLFNMSGTGDWFVLVNLLLYLLFPLMNRLIRRFHWVPVAVTVIPWFIRPWLQSVGIGVDHLLFCLTAFATGILLAQKGFLDRLAGLKGVKYKLIAGLTALVMFGMRLIFSLNADYFFALSLIGLGTVVLAGAGELRRALILFGKHSANIWLVHVMLLRVLSAIVVLPNICRYLIVLLASLALSILVEFLKKKLGYLQLVKRLRACAEGRSAAKAK